MQSLLVHLEMLSDRADMVDVKSIIDDINESYIQQEKEQIIKHIDRYCDFYGHKNVGEQLYNAWYVEPILKPINK